MPWVPSCSGGYRGDVTYGVVYGSGWPFPRPSHPHRIAARALAAHHVS
jgi:hypothetical protein